MTKLAIQVSKTIQRLLTRKLLSSQLGRGSCAWNRAILMVFVVALASCAHQSVHSPGLVQEGSQHADDLLIIDCLLPGQIRQLGRDAQYITARRPIKTSVIDCKIRGGEYVAYDRADFSTALKVWLPLAEQGDAEAQNYVGEIFERGLGIVPDYAQAAQWFEKSAAQNFSRAQINVGNLYEKGLGVELNIAKALNYYRLAAGLNTDQLDYVSSMEATHVKLDEFKNLKNQYELQSQEKTRLEARLVDAKTALNHNKQTVTQLTREMDTLNESLVAAKQLLLAPGFDMPQAQQSKVNIASMETELQKKQQDVRQHREQILSLNTELNRVSGALQSLHATAAQAPPVSPPSIQIIEPAMTLNRSGPMVRLRSATPFREIIGKVEAPAGLLRLLVNDQQQKIDRQSLFWASIPIKGSRTPVQVTAIDQRGERVSFDFTFIKNQPDLLEADTQSSESSPASKALEGRYYALVIGNNDYQAFPNLVTARNDAIKTAEVLTHRYGFEVQLLENATRYEILSALNEYRTQLKPADNFLIYYAGHGELDSLNERGYWLPVDAESSSTANWISNVAISDTINTLAAKHIMVVADSCYAGTLSAASMARPDALLNPKAREKWVNVMAKAKARTVLTAGGVSPVRDGGGGEHSVFARAFLEALKNNDQLLEGYSLYLSILKRMSLNPNMAEMPQSPDYAPIKHSGHEAGEFFFQPLAAI